MPIQFPEALAKFTKFLELSPQLITERITLDLWNKITEKTPVDTGRARAGWQITLNAPGKSVPPEMGKGTGKHKKSSMPPPEPDVAYPNPKITGKEVVFITNNLPYIGVLEEGSSKQAPAGMVRTSIAEVKAGIRLTVEMLEQSGSL